ncbi:MAG: hypothetical protein K6E38_04305 [Fretibacterium sp.]|nr:hypothetical protein [Fretibacterium sp.]
MIISLLWLLQDILTVLFGGVMQIPELFLLGIVYRLLKDEDEERVWAIWSAFLGGLLWDLRWVGIPGFFTFGYVAVVLLVLWLWSSLPLQGRTGLVAFLLLESSQLIPPLLPVLILGGNTGGSFFLMEQIYALPALLFCLWLYGRHTREAGGTFSLSSK